MGKTVLAIGLDSVEPRVLEHYLAQGWLPNLQRLRDQSGYGHLQFSGLFNAELPWTTFILGQRPTEVGYWDFFTYHPDRYDVTSLEAYDFSERKPFWALGDGFKVAAVDVPQARIVEGVNGIQVTAWGAHSPQAPTMSSPPALIDELKAKYGLGPAMHNDGGQTLRLQDVARVRPFMAQGARQRAAMCLDLMGREEWDLFLTVFSEPHVAGHNFWQVSWPDHPLYDTLHARVYGDPMREAYESVDRAIGTMLDAVPDDTPVVLFSVHGMGQNTTDLPNGIFLPELVYRWNFPGHEAIRGKRGDPLPPQYTECGSFHHEVWLSKYDTNPLRRSGLKRLPWGVFTRTERYLGQGDLGIGLGDLVSPFELGRQTTVCPWIGSQWYRQLWPHMKAFAIPCFSDGCVRVNVRGRDGSGVVEPADYERVCDELEALLYSMRDCRRGIRMARNVVRVREDPFDDDRRLHEADLIVEWQSEFAADSVEAPGYGRIGPVPPIRAGSHLSTGFCMIRHPQVEAGAKLPKGDVRDLAPTLLTMMDAPLSPHFEGQSLVAGATASPSA